MNRAIARRRKEVHHDLRTPVTKLCTGDASFVVHSEAFHDALRRLVAGIDDRHDARPHAQHMFHGRPSALRRVAKSPAIARQPPADLVVAGGAEGLDAEDADDTLRRFFDERAHADAEFHKLPCLAGQELVDLGFRVRQAAVHVLHHLRILGEPDKRLAIGGLPGTNEQSFSFEPEHNAIIIRAMRIAVVGAGGVGGYFGAKLAQAGEDVTFIARGATLDALRGTGIRVDSIRGDFALDRVNATDDPASVGAVDAVLVAVKAWQVAAIAPALKPLLGRETAVVPLENGIEAPDDLIRGLGADNVLGGLCAIVSFVVAPGHIRHAASEPIVAFGELDNRRSARAEGLLLAMRNAGINADIPPDIQRSLWTKFVFITPMSAIGAVARVPIGVWRNVPETRELAMNAVREVMALAAAKGITLAPDALELTMKRYDGLAPQSTASMQRDVMDGRPSELEAQVGAVVRMGAALNVPTPINDVFYAALVPQERKARGEI